MRFVRLLLTVAFALVVFAPPAEAAGTKTYVVRFTTPDGGFTARIEDPASVQRIDDALADRHVEVGIPNGVVVRGDGGINRNHDWHVEDVELVDVAIEVCDGTVAYVDEHLDQWLDEVGRYCPWGARVVWLWTDYT
jgi:hypothetical protein